MNTAKIPLLIMVLFLSVSAAYALDPIPQEPGFSGFVRAGAGVMNYKSNMVAGVLMVDLGDKTIDSLTDTPGSKTQGYPSLNYELAWTFADSRTQITFGSQLEDVARMELGQQLAVKQELPDKSILSAGLLLTNIPTEVWKDPYVTGMPRDESDRTSYGARIVFDRILGSGFEVKYSYRKIEIDDEQSGVFLGLSPDQRDLLRRDGNNHFIDLNYGMTFQQKHRIMPGISYFKRHRDGDAMSNWGTTFQMTYICFDNPVVLVLNGLIGMADYDKTNPVFGKTQEDDLYSANMQVVYRNPFGWKPFGHENFSMYVTGSYLLNDANIDFYDTEVFTGIVGAMFRF